MYAVAAGGGHNHRLDLAVVLLKENYIAAAVGVTAAIHRRLRRELAPDSGIDAISAGTLTHSAPAMDLTMLLSISRS